MSYALNASTEHVVRQQDNKAQYSLALIAALQKTYNNKKYATTVTTTTTTTVLRPFCRDYPGEPVPEEKLLDFMVQGKINRHRPSGWGPLHPE